jgi:hypothetical protein
MLSGPVVVWLHWPYSTTMAFLPLLVGLVERIRVRHGAAYVAALALAVALDLFAGYPQGALWSILVAGVWALTRARGVSGGALSFLVRVAGGFVLGGLAAAVQLLPFIEYAGESAVALYRTQWMPYLWLPGRAALTWLVPFFFGGIRDFRGDWNFNTVTLTVGLVPWVALPVAFAVAWRSTATQTLTALALAAVTIVYGVPWFGPTLASLPVVGWGLSLRVAPVLSFAVAMLGAIGIDAIISAGPHLRRRVSFAVAGTVAALVGIIFAAVVAHPDALVRSPGRWSTAQHVIVFLVAVTVTALAVLRWVRRPEERLRWSAVLLAVEIATLAPVGASVNVAGDAAWLYPEPPVMRALRAATVADHSRILLGRHNLAMLYGLSDPTGHDGMTPVNIEAIAGPLGTGRTIGNVGSEPLSAGVVFSSAAIDVLGVRWFVVPPHAGSPHPDTILRYDSSDARVYENLRAMPRAFLVPTARCVSNAESRALVRPRVDWTREVILTDDCDRASSGTPGPVGAAIIRKHAADRVVVDVSGATPAYLVLTDAWFAGWRVTVDGEDARMFRADHAFRAVWVCAGQHTVEFRYRPTSVAIGALVSGLAIGVIGVLAVGPRWRQFAVAGAVLCFALGTRDAAALAPMPVEFTVHAHATHLDNVPLMIAPRVTSGGRAEPVDLYLMWAFRPDSRFIAPDGAWSSEPTPVRRSVKLADLAPFTVNWRADPVGAISIALIAVKTGGDPIDRAGWIWAPELSWVTVRPAWALEGRIQWLVAGLGLGALSSITVLLLYARRA